MAGRMAANQATEQTDRADALRPGRWQRLSQDAGDANLGQTILRLAGLAEASHRFEQVRGELRAAGVGAAALEQVKDSGLRQVVSAPVGIGQVRTDAGADRSSQPRTEVGR